MSIKLAIARRQICAALALFLDDKDPVSVHCLACGGGEIAYRLAQAAGKKPWIDEAITANPTVSWKELFGQRNEFWNAMEHATDRKGQMRSDDELLSQFDDLHNDELLFISIYDYVLASDGFAPVDVFLYNYWFLARYPEVLGPCEVQQEAETLFPGIAEIARHRAKARLRRIIQKYRNNPSLWLHQNVDRRPLILDRKVHSLLREDAVSLPLSKDGTVH